MTMRGWLVLWMIAGGLVAGDARAAAPIDPATLVGTWAGTWESESFKPHPTATEVAKTTILLAKQ